MWLIRQWSCRTWWSTRSDSHTWEVSIAREKCKSSSHRLSTPFEAHSNRMCWAYRLNHNNGKVASSSAQIAKIIAPLITISPQIGVAWRAETRLKPADDFNPIIWLSCLGSGCYMFPPGKLQWVTEIMGHKMNSSSRMFDWGIGQSYFVHHSYRYRNFHTSAGKSYMTEGMEWLKEWRVNQILWHWYLALANRDACHFPVLETVGARIKDSAVAFRVVSTIAS